MTDPIIELQRQNAELTKERDLLRALMEGSSDCIYFKDLDSRFIRCSRALYESFGATAEEVIGKTDFDFFGEEHAREAYEDEQQIIRTGQSLVGKIERETWKERHDSWALTAKMPLRNGSGEIIGTVGISKDFTAIKQAEAELAQMHRQLLDSSRIAGMAEVATSILHNVGNVLNSVNVSCSVVADKVRNSRVVNVAKLAALLDQNRSDLPGFFAGAKGGQLPAYLSELATHLVAEREAMLAELDSLASNIEHIKEIVAAQQSYAKTAGVVELIEMAKLVDDAIEMHRDAMGRHAVKIVREYSSAPAVMVDKHKILQILINLIQNAKYALDEGGPPEKRLVLRVCKHGEDRVRITVTDNGAGIVPENLPRVFEHGFTTRKNGHGFGLHSGALTARELGGSLTAHSEGTGRGATFILEIPCDTRKAAA